MSWRASSISVRRRRTCGCPSGRCAGCATACGPTGRPDSCTATGAAAPSTGWTTRLRASIVDKALTTYAGFNPVHLAETLAEEDPAIPSARTVQRILAAAGDPPAPDPAVPRPPQPAGADAAGRHAAPDRRLEARLARGPGPVDDPRRRDRRRDRRPSPAACSGPPRTPPATSRCCSRRSAATACRSRCTPTCRAIFIKDPNRPPTLAEQLTGRRCLTQVGRALDELGIRWIGARSPEAKGRVERLWGTLQDRLRVRAAAGAASPRSRMPTSCSPGTCPATTAASRSSLPSRTPPGGPWPPGLPPEAVLCFEYPRRAARDATVGWDGGASRCPGAWAGPAGQAAGSSSRSGSTGACGPATGASCTRSSRPHPPPRPAGAQVPPGAGARRSAGAAAARRARPVSGVDRRPHAARSKADHPWRRYPAVRPKPR